jgi:citrate lyase beta subunit
MRVDASLLYTPALRIGAVGHALKVGAHFVVLDLEDSIPRGRKAEARELLAGADLTASGLGGVGLRVNTLATPDGLLDMKALIDWDGTIGGLPVETVFVPKVSTGSDVAIYRSLLSGLTRPPEICTFIETVDAVENAFDIAAQSDGLCFGQADLAAEMYAPNESYLEYARVRLCVAAAKHRMPAVDTNSFELKDKAKLREQCAAARRAGFTGKAAIHPGQVEIINETFTVAPEELDRYRQTIRDYESTANGFAVEEDRVLAPPFVAKAQRMLRLYDGAGAGAAGWAPQGPRPGARGRPGPWPPLSVSTC